jgi:CHAD domain-containing protein
LFLRSSSPLVSFHMPVDRDRSRLVFQKLGRRLSKLGVKSAPENVHKFRTSSRRVEALLQELVAEPNRNDKKLLKLLSRLRRKAGRVRDLDVQISALRSLKIPQEPARKAQLLHLLTEERARREHRLAKAFGGQTVRELRRRLKRAAGDAEIPDGKDAVRLALRQLAALGRNPDPLTEKILHQYRIAGKRARYIAELGGKDAEAQRLVEQLKHMQDAIGDWHDWLKLAQKAEELFGGVREAPLVSALHNVTRAKFRHALDALAATRAAFSTPKPMSVAMAAGRKPAGRSPKLMAAA